MALGSEINSPRGRCHPTVCQGCLQGIVQVDMERLQGLTSLADAVCLSTLDE